MSATYFALLTNIGAAKMANATALGSRLNLTRMAVGDGGGTLPMPNPAQTALINEKRRAALNGLSIDPKNPSQIIAEQVIPENEGGWWIREIGLFDDDGNLIAVANCPETYKPQLQEGSGRIQTVRMILIVSSTDAVTLKIDPAVVLATRGYVDNAVIEVKAYADTLLAQHIAAKNPHPQYALKTDLTAWRYEATGGEVEAILPYTFTAAMVFINGIEQALNYSFSLDGNRLLFPEPLRKGDFINVVFPAPIATQRTASSSTDDFNYEVAELRKEINALTGRVFLSADGGNILSTGKDNGIFLPDSALQKINGVDVNTQIN
ncbi:phage tail protein [Pectobacterium sp. IFB5596]|uniref:phage tail protein n=1 Tax=Pectobacterium sp. IFB5596 TaxID=1839803 RepID=UPI001F414FA8|nr:phage tail protein [Pectobacterium sp. IFB5596]